MVGNGLRGLAVAIFEDAAPRQTRPCTSLDDQARTGALEVGGPRYLQSTTVWYDEIGEEMMMEGGGEDVEKKECTSGRGRRVVCLVY